MDGKDTWWSCTTIVSEELIRIVGEVVLPYFATINSEYDMYDRLGAHPSYCDEVLMYKLAKALLARSVGEAEVYTELMNELQHVGGRKWGGNIVRMRRL
ncbi:MAG: hypothetical protein VCD00_01935 [Candidatus Hydrogenedentota bacterium]|jgi:hypothetical protein